MGKVFDSPGLLPAIANVLNSGAGSGGDVGLPFCLGERQRSAHTLSGMKRKCQSSFCPSIPFLDWFITGREKDWAVTIRPVVHLVRISFCALESLHSRGEKQIVNK